MTDSEILDWIESNVPRGWFRSWFDRHVGYSSAVFLKYNGGRTLWRVSDGTLVSPWRESLRDAVKELAVMQPDQKRATGPLRTV